MVYDLSPSLDPIYQELMSGEAPVQIAFSIAYSTCTCITIHVLNELYKLDYDLSQFAMYLGSLSI